MTNALESSAIPIVVAPVVVSEGNEVTGSRTTEYPAAEVCGVKVKDVFAVSMSVVSKSSVKLSG